MSGFLGLGDSNGDVVDFSGAPAATDWSAVNAYIGADPGANTDIYGNPIVPSLTAWLNQNMGLVYAAVGLFVAAIFFLPAGRR